MAIKTNPANLLSDIKPIESLRLIDYFTIRRRDRTSQESSVSVRMTRRGGKVRLGAFSPKLAHVREGPPVPSELQNSTVCFAVVT